MLEGGCRVHQNLTICLCFMHLHLASSNPSNPNPKSVTEAKPVESHDSILRVNNCWSETWIMGEVHLTISNSYFFVISFIWMENSISPARNLWICEMFGGHFERKKTRSCIPILFSIDLFWRFLLLQLFDVLFGKSPPPHNNQKVDQREKMKKGEMVFPTHLKHIWG